MTRITTPFDSFLAGLIEWLGSAWFVWAALLAVILLVALVVTISKARARARARVPQYRRLGSGSGQLTGGW